MQAAIDSYYDVDISYCMDFWMINDDDEANDGFIVEKMKVIYYK